MPKPKKYVSDIPELMAKWNWEKNNKLGLNPSAITYGSQKKVWWICKRGHEWEAVVSQSRYSGCPYCAGQKVWIGYNDLATMYPEIAKEWHPTKNGDLKPTNVTSSSNKKVWWKCKRGHEWEATISSRAFSNNCPYCSNKKVLVGYNDLATTHSELSKQWHPTKNENLTPIDVTSGSGKKVWWICDEGHEWQAIINSRARGKGCPYCFGRYVITNKTDLATTHPEIAKQWHPTKNGNLKPSDVTASSKTKVWWMCNCGTEWYSTVNDATKKYKKLAIFECPTCAIKRGLKNRNKTQ